MQDCRVGLRPPRNDEVSVIANAVKQSGFPDGLFRFAGNDIFIPRKQE
jgi:hypothetical protein